MIDNKTLSEQRFCTLPVSERFELDWMTKAEIKRMKPDWGYGAYSEFIFYSRWSRRKTDGNQETWADVIIRVIEGTFSIRKQFYRDHALPWDEAAMRLRAREMALSAFRGEWGPPGRGYWFMGTPLMYEIGSFGLSNCAFVDVIDLPEAAHFLADALMMGAGVGFSTWHDVVSGLQLPRHGSRMVTATCPIDDVRKGYPTCSYLAAREHFDNPDVGTIVFVVPDSREGWADSIKLLLESYHGGPVIRFDYSRLRSRGTPIKGFGGEASGAFPLRALHRKLRIILDRATHERWPSSQLVTDVMNLIGCMVVAGNVRRSALLSLGSPRDPVFAQLKHYADVGPDGELIPTQFWYRRRHGWASNNSYALTDRESFELIPTIADGIRRNGEPGFLNLLNVRKFGRIGDRPGTLLPGGHVLREDPAIGVNPCGEACLESFETCVLAEWYPTRCLKTDGTIDLERAVRAAEHAAFYTQTVQLLPTHRPETNAVIARNRRTGVSLAGAAGLREITTMAEAIKLMELGYEAIRRENTRLSRESGVPEAIRVTVEKPSGTTALVMGVPAGAHWPTGGYILRRTRITDNKMALRDVLDRAGVPHERDLYSHNTEVYSFPIKTIGADTIRPVHEVSMWEQADFAATLAQHFVDQAVSVTITFDPLTRAEKAANIQRLMTHYQHAQRQIALLKGLLEMSKGEEAQRVQRQLAQAREESRRCFEAIMSLQARLPEGDDVERLIASFAGKLKSMSMLPRSNHGYAQAPEEVITREEYEQMITQIGELDWSGFAGDGEAELFCSSCEPV